MVRKIECPSTIGSVLIQPDSTNQFVPGSRPSWKLQHKARNEHDDNMREASLLKNGFGEFYSQTAPSQKLADTAKRHLTQDAGKEETWRPCYKAVPQPAREPRAFGKRFIEPPAARQDDDVPRGKKHVPPPSDSLGEEMAMFQSRRRVRNETTGVARAEEVTDINTAEPASLEGRRHLRQGSRNGLPQLSNGDKMYSHVQFSPEYLAMSNPARARLGLEKPATRVEIANTWVVKDRQMQYQRDVSEVRALPNFGGVDDD